jgi:hypothetical protein
MAETSIAVLELNLEELLEVYYQVFTGFNKDFQASSGISFIIY